MLVRKDVGRVRGLPRRGRGHQKTEAEAGHQKTEAEAGPTKGESSFRIFHVVLYRAERAASNYSCGVGEGAALPGLSCEPGT